MKTYPNCKINLGLHVVRRREDGYHDLQTVFCPVPLCDELEITPAEEFSFEQSGISIDGDAEQNLVVKAYRLMQRETGGLVGSAAIRLHKRIPFGAGLGGGSSDAAFALRMINDLFELGMTDERLCRLAARLGADCPFFICNKAAYATGIGDKLEPMDHDPLKGHTLVLVKPDEAVSTAEAYRGVTPRETLALPCPDLPTLLKQPAESWKGAVENDFEPSVFRSHPRLAKVKEKLYGAGALYASMSGSGSAIYGIFESGFEPELDLNDNCNTYTFNL